MWLPKLLGDPGKDASGELNGDNENGVSVNELGVVIESCDGALDDRDGDFGLSFEYR